ncbi:uncharacterized protein LOC129590363 isoform X2 [Paramacrobiotus metropolitanus]|uniref:uncharacterized protein LOC129590363 isoform X2 n=1 Tax=Paramacrobiotus metropolitanus TaxID=2943436 RepID=UPI00244606D6|nr:uncharacterized protein LOC129590363 isoform X2 [Paramacrobiotus metropolitanus]
MAAYSWRSAVVQCAVCAVLLQAALDAPVVVASPAVAPVRVQYVDLWPLANMLGPRSPCSKIMQISGSSIRKAFLFSPPTSWGSPSERTRTSRSLAKQKALQERPECEVHVDNKTREPGRCLYTFGVEGLAGICQTYDRTYIGFSVLCVKHVRPGIPSMAAKKHKRAHRSQRITAHSQ